jgi:hypothetical protein
MPLPAAVLRWCAVGAIAVAGVSACGGTSRGAGEFCSRLQRQHDALISGVVDEKTAKAAVDGYNALDRLAPEAIRSEWHQLALLVQAAASLDPAVPASNATLVEQAYTAAPAAQTVAAYARQTCGIDLAPSATPPAVTTGPTTVPASPAGSG